MDAEATAAEAVSAARCPGLSVQCWQTADVRAAHQAVGAARQAAEAIGADLAAAAILAVAAQEEVGKWLWQTINLTIWLTI